jgi:hypothetical protein
VSKVDNQRSSEDLATRAVLAWKQIIPAAGSPVSVEELKSRRYTPLTKSAVRHMRGMGVGGTPVTYSSVVKEAWPDMNLATLRTLAETDA